MGYSSQELLQQMREQGAANVQIPGQPAPAAPAGGLATSAPNAATLFNPDAAKAASSAPASGPAAAPKPVGGPAPQSFSPAGSHGFNAPKAPDPLPLSPAAAPRGNLEATMMPSPGGFGGAPAPAPSGPMGGPRGNLEATMMPQAGGFGGAPASGPRGNLEATMLPQAGGFGGAPPSAAGTPPHAAAGLAHGHGPSPLTDPNAPVFGPSVTDAPSAPVPTPSAGTGSTPVRKSPTTQEAMSAVGITGGHLGLWSIVFGVLMLGWFAAIAYPFSNFAELFSGDAMMIFAVPALIGLFAVFVGVLPIGPTPKGAIIAVLGLGGLGVATSRVAHLDVMTDVVFTYGYVVLLAGLVARGAYPSSFLSRILVTFGALAVLASVLVPNEAGLPLVQSFQALGGADTAILLGIVLHLAVVLIAVVSLLAWMPAPGSGGAPVFFWLLLVLPALAEVVPGLVGGDTSLKTLVAWQPELSLCGLAGYGLGAFLGKLSA